MKKFHIIIKLIQFQYKSLKVGVDGRKNFLKFEKTQIQKAKRKFLGSFFGHFLSIETIVVGYRYYRIHQGIDTIKWVLILLSSLVATDFPMTEYFVNHMPHATSSTIISGICEASLVNMRRESSLINL